MATFHILPFKTRLKLFKSRLWLCLSLVDASQYKKVLALPTANIHCLPNRTVGGDIKARVTVKGKRFRAHYRIGAIPTETFTPLVKKAKHQTSSNEEVSFQMNRDSHAKGFSHFDIKWQLCGPFSF